MRKLGVVGITLLGLWTAIEAVNSLFASLTFSSSTGDGVGITYVAGFYIAPAMVLLVLGYALIALRERLAARWFEDDSAVAGPDPESLLRIGIIIVGVVFAVIAFQMALTSVLRPIIVAANDRAIFGPGDTGSQPLWTILPGIIARVVQMLIGILLVWFSRPLASWFWRRQVVGTPQSSPELAACPECGVQYDPADYREGGTPRCVKCGQPLDGSGA